MTRTLLSLALLACACDKADRPTPAPALPEPSAATLSAPADASIAPALAVAIPHPAPSASATQAATSRALPPAASAATPVDAAAPVSAATVAPGVGMHFDAPSFAVDAPAPAACDKGAVCTFTVRVTAKDEFHVNKDYPYKLKMEDAAGGDFAGRDTQGKNVFSKSAGDFALDGEKSGVMTVRVTAASSGPMALTGTLKLSVCNAANCMLEQAQVHVTVPVR